MAEKTIRDTIVDAPCDKGWSTGTPSSSVPLIMVHGGAGTYALILHDDVARAVIDQGVKDAARAGYSILESGGTAVDAVEAAAASMEDNPTFNAGRGSCLTKDGGVEMDACIQDGRTLRSGAVGCIQHVTNPIKVARLVMDKSDHVLFVGKGAEKFARDQGVELCSTESLVTQKSRKRLEKFATFNPSVKVDFRKAVGQEKDGSHDTVGAVAVDSEGHVAFATTTGGINAKMPGRCGDSAILGCGGLSDDRIGAISTTGHGESFIKTSLARQIGFFVQQGFKVQDAVEKGLALTLEDVGGCGGAIAVTPDGDVAVSFNTDGMSWARASNGNLSYGIYHGETLWEQL